MTDINRALLIEWGVRQLGKAVLVAVSAAIVCAFIGAMFGAAVWLPSLAAPLGFAVSLMTAKVPAAYTESEQPQLEVE